MDAQQMFQEQHNRCMKKARAAAARLRTLTMTYGIVPESVRAMQVAFIHAVALDVSEHWWDPKKRAGRMTSNSSSIDKPGPS